MYDLVRALGETAETRQVYKTYVKDTTCEECIELWNRLIKQEEGNIDAMKELLISHIEEAKFT